MATKKRAKRTKRQKRTKTERRAIANKRPNPQAADFALIETVFAGDRTLRPITRKKLAKFMVRLRFYSVISSAAREAQISRTDLDKWRHRNPAFNLEVEKAILGATEDLVADGFTCAKLATSDPRYQPSLIFLLKAKAGFRQVDRVEVTGKDGKPIAAVTKTIAGKNYSSMSDEELRQLAFGRKAIGTAESGNGSSGS